MGKFKEAESFLQRIIKIQKKALGETHPYVLNSTYNLAWLYGNWGYYEQAERMQRQVLEKRRTLFGKHPNVAETLHELGMMLLNQGHYGQAEQVFCEALEMKRTTLGETHPDLELTLVNLGIVYAATGRQDEALTLLKQTLDKEERTLGHIFSISSERQRMAYVEKVQHRLDIFLSLIIQYFSTVSEAIRSGLEVVLRRKAIGLEAMVMQHESVLSGHYPELATRLGELTKQRKQIAESTWAGPGSESPESYQKRLRELHAHRDSLEADLAQHIPQMSLLQHLERVNLQAVARTLPENAILVEFVLVHLYDFHAVPAHEERRRQPARYIAFVLLASQPEQTWLIDLGDAESIDRLVAKFRSSITGEDEGNDPADLNEPMPGNQKMSQVAHIEAKEGRHLRPDITHQQNASSLFVGYALRRLVFDPLRQYIGTSKRLFLAPDGSLNRLPFEVLPQNETTRLIDQYSISYLSAGRDLLQFGNRVRRPITPAPALVVASPDFDLTADEDLGSSTFSRQQSEHDDRHFPRLNFSPLGGTKKEGQHIAELLKVKPLLEKQALESLVKKCSSPHILHLATHGFFLPDQQRDPNVLAAHEDATIVIVMEGSRGVHRLAPLTGLPLHNPMVRSGLALAGANTRFRGGALPAEAEDGILTAEDVTGLDLLDTELVVLSACETGLGEVKRGEGVFGLRRAFTLAGAKTLVMSLWKVPDQQTQELMVDFYQRILSGQPRAQALREAQITMKAKYPHPLFWGAFICQGEPDPLASKTE